MYRILIVDDDRIMREAFKVMIGKIDGFEVCAEAVTGQQGVDFYCRFKPDIIFMDIFMPGMNGIDAIREIRRMDPDVVIYIFSAYSNFELAKEAVQLQVREYVMKLVPFRTLKRILMTYKTDREGDANYYLNQIQEMVAEKDFRKMYYSIGDVVEQIYRQYGEDPGKLKEIFGYIGHRLISSVNMDETEMPDVKKLFPINTEFLTEKVVGEMWLFRVINYVFGQNSIQRYPVLQSVFEFIEANIYSEIGLERITEECAISQGYLSRIFKSQFQVSVMEYLHMRKIHIAKNYFFFTNASIAEVAERLGYSESSYFSKVFKKYEHKTIQQYRKSIFA